jgi:death-on-curing protein
MSTASIRRLVGPIAVTIEEKAAALTEALARNHGFVDGNKRTAVYAMDLLLTRSGYKLRDDDLDRLNQEWRK